MDQLIPETKSKNQSLVEFKNNLCHLFRNMARILLLLKFKHHYPKNKTTLLLQPIFSTEINNLTPPPPLNLEKELPKSNNLNFEP
jgi:hypothetical protein